MNARTEAEVDTMKSEFSARVPESAIINFLEDYDLNKNVAERIISLNQAWKTNSIETIIRCVYLATAVCSLVKGAEQ